MLCKRVHDCSHIGIQLFINGQKLPMNSWEEYVCSYPITPIDPDNDAWITWEETKDKNMQWKIAFISSTKGMQNIYCKLC